MDNITQEQVKYILHWLCALNMLKDDGHECKFCIYKYNCNEHTDCVEGLASGLCKLWR